MAQSQEEQGLSINFLELLGQYSDAAQVVIAVLALITAVASVWLSIAALKKQQKHNEITVFPVVRVMISDFENRLRVRISNLGLGPAKIVSVICHCSARDIKDSKLQVLMPDLKSGVHWTNFSGDLSETYMSVGGHRTLLEFTVPTDMNGDSSAFEQSKTEIRRALSVVTVTVVYEDVYGNRQQTKKPLDWFGRHFANEEQKK